MVRVEHVLDSWNAVRQDTATAVEDFPADQFDFRATPEMAAFGEYARPILDAADGLIGLLLEGGDNSATPEFRERLNSTGATCPRIPAGRNWRRHCGRRRRKGRPSCGLNRPSFSARW